MQAPAARQNRSLQPGRAIPRLLLTGVVFAIAAFGVLEVMRPGPQPGDNTRQGPPTDPTPLSGTVLEPVAPAAPPAPAPDIARRGMPELPPPPVVAEREDAVATATPDAAARLNAEKELRLTGPDSQRQAALDRDQELLELALTGAAWDAYRGLLARSIQSCTAGIATGQGNERCRPVWETPALYKALLRWNLLTRFPQAAIVSHFPDHYSAPVWLWLLDQPAAMEELLLTLKPEDDPGAVLKFLKDAWTHNEERFEKYYPLALACAVVFDRPLRISHPVGDQRYDETTVDPLKRYLWYVENNEKGKLVAPVHHSNARDLVWVVCAPVSTSELDWAIRKLHGRRGNWGNHYGLIEYVMERAVEGFHPYSEYTFAEILKHGGICGDQTYFCVNTARAHGIPAMGISGETDSGGHAWAGLKTSAREWSTSIGRIAGASKGTADNPQTGRRITEQEILHWNDRHHQSGLTTLAVHRHLWLADFLRDRESLDDHAAIVRLANRIGPSFTATWSALHAVLEREMEYTGEPAVPSNLDEWKAFVGDMRRQFKDNPRMAGLAAAAEVEYIFPYVGEGDITRALLRDRRRIQRDSGEQADLIADSLKRQAEVIARRGGPDATRDISRLYDRALRDYGGSITGFKMMADDYFRHMRADPELARKAARDIELAFKRVVETGTKDWFRATTEAGIYRSICGYYREAGDVKRAEMLEKRIDTLVRRSRRGAL
jgi:hypothetical protein